MKKKEFGIKTIKNRLIVEVIPHDEITKSGLFCPADPELVKSGLVVQATAKCSVKVGDIAYFNHDIGTKIKFQGKNYLVMRDDNLVAMRSQNG